MITNTILQQLMGPRMNGIMNEITNNDLDHQEIVRKSGVYFDELAALQLPEETRLYRLQRTIFRENRMSHEILNR